MIATPTIHLLFSLLFILYFAQPQSPSTSCQLTGNYTCSAPPTCPNSTSTITFDPNFLYNCTSKDLNLKASSITLQGTFLSSLNLTAQTIVVKNTIVEVNLTLQHQTYIEFSGSVTVGNTLFANATGVGSSISNDQVTILFTESTLSAKRLAFQTFGTINITNSTISNIGVLCLYHPIQLSDFSTNVWNSKYSDLIKLIDNTITIGFLNFGSVNMESSTIEGSTVAMISQQNISFIDSFINTTARACRTNMGSGHGLIVQVQQDFCSSGSAGAGYGLTSNFADDPCYEILEYFMFLTHSFPYMNKGPTLSTGSGGYGYNYFQNSLKGAGGGIVYVFAKDQIYTFNTTIEASGGNVGVEDSLSAGSAGVVYMYSQILGGNQTNISAYGGSSFNNKGAGAGGMVKISYQELIKIHHGVLWINTSQGYQPNNAQFNIESNGIFYGPMCPSGEIRWYLGCQTCGPFTYNQISNEFCLACPVSRDFQWNPDLNGIQNPWDCFQSIEIKPYYEWITPGQINIVSISCYIGLLVVFVIFGVIIRRQIKKIKAKNDDIECDFEALQKQMKEEKILTDRLKKEKTIKLYELMYHMHRITVAGSNTYLCPWVLPLVPPQSIKKYILLEAYENFARKFNKMSHWTKGQIFIVKLLYLAYPLHWFYYDLVKKRKYRKLCKLLQEFRQYNLINNFQFQDKDLITLKFSKNKDYTSCYIDFFFYEKADLSYYNLSVPFILYLSGQGNFIRPFYIEENDPFVKAMTFIVNRNTYSEKQPENAKSQQYFNDDKEKLLRNLVNLNLRKKNQAQLKKFIINFNAISCTLDLSAPINHFIKTLSILIDFINLWNRKFFNRVKVQIDLILMRSDLHQENIVSSSIHILSNKNEDFLQKVKAIIPRMNLNNEIDLKLGLFIYNPEQEISKKDLSGEVSLQRNTVMSGEFGRSEDDLQDNEMSENLLQSEEQQPAKQQNLSSLHAKFTRYLCLFRYFMLSHQITTYDRYMIKLFQSFLILTQTALVFIWSIKIELPYVFNNLMAPFIGIIWIVSDSYGFGKLFLIINAMNLLNEIATPLIYALADRYKSQDVIKVVICQSISVTLVGLNMLCGSRSITYSKKFNTSE